MRRCFNPLRFHTHTHTTHTNLQYDEGMDGSGDNMSASEARKRLEFFRNKARKDEHKKLADKVGQ